MKLNLIIKAVWAFIMYCLGRKEPTDRDRIKKRIREIDREISKNIKGLKIAEAAGHIEQLNFYADKLRDLRRRRNELQKILNS